MKMAPRVALLAAHAATCAAALPGFDDLPLYTKWAPSFVGAQQIVSFSSGAVHGMSLRC